MTTGTRGTTIVPSRAATAARTLLLLALTAIALIPLGVIVLRTAQSGPRALAAFVSPQALEWFANSLLVTGVTVAVSLVVGAPAAYVLARGRSRLVSGYGLVVFGIQSFPVFLALVPLFVVFARIGLIDTLPGLMLIYVGSTIATVTWMLTSAVASIPISLEEAAWLDGCSLASGFVRVVLRNCLPALTSAGVFAFLLAWNEYLVAVVVLRSTSNYTLGVALSAAYGSPGLALLMMLPPVAVFLVFRRWFTLGGVAGSLAGT